MYGCGPDLLAWRGDAGRARGSVAHAGLQDFPADLADYLSFVEAVLRRARPNLFGLKLLLGYQRTLHFESVSVEAAGAALPDCGQPQSQPLSRLSGLHGPLAVQISRRAGPSAPDSRLVRRTVQPPATAEQSPVGPATAALRPGQSRDRVVLLHGGYPFISQAGALAWHYPRVYLDFSVLPTLFTLPLARWLEEWIELLPRNKILFGTDASSPEEYYTASVNGPGSSGSPGQPAVRRHPDPPRSRQPGRSHLPPECDRPLSAARSRLSGAAGDRTPESCGRS